ncbi:MAG: HutD family protein [Crocinitomicaceae bacterium]|nr:HutD family protein [Crocinitomicaceae bacterium]MDG1776342.1 HutD family protein [Crocinitomicaceae bacterium]
MPHHFIPSNSVKTIKWSGGTSSELFIYPEGSDFKTGNYQVRLSIATVEVETSVFTSLPGVNRTLMVLKGQLHLKHEGQHETVLNPLEKDQFSGNWNTKSWGKVTDFNLMTKGNCNGVLNGYSLKETQTLSLHSSEQKTFIHIREGIVNINNTRAEPGASILFTGTNRILIDALKDALIVVVEIKNLESGELS